MKSLFVALAGPSGVGKSYVIDGILKFFPGKYTYVKPFTTRALREGETNKIHIVENEFQKLIDEGDILLPNNLYGFWYGPSRSQINSIIESGSSPIIDWPIQRIPDLRREIHPIDTICLYITPPDLRTLKQRLSNDDRDKTGERYKSAKDEIDTLWNRGYDGIDSIIVNEGENIAKQADLIISSYMENILK